MLPEYGSDSLDMVMRTVDNLIDARDQIERLKHELHVEREKHSGVPLTAENADRAWVAVALGSVWVRCDGAWLTLDHRGVWSDKAMAGVHGGATVLAWKP